MKIALTESILTCNKAGACRKKAIIFIAIRFQQTFNILELNQQLYESHLETPSFPTSFGFSLFLHYWRTRNNVDGLFSNDA